MTKRQETKVQGQDEDNKTRTAAVDKSALAR